MNKEFLNLLCNPDRHINVNEVFHRLNISSCLVESIVAKLDVLFKLVHSGMESDSVYFYDFIFLHLLGESVMPVQENCVLVFK